jgi:hypothetical protein
VNESQTEPNYRAISVITLIQTGVIVAGTLFVTAMCKLKGYGGGVVPDSFFNSAALFVRSSDWTLLLIPVLWATFAIFAVRFELHPWLQRALIGIGIVSILFGIYHYIILGFNPCIL